MPKSRASTGPAGCRVAFVLFERGVGQPLSATLPCCRRSRSDRALAWALATCPAASLLLVRMLAVAAMSLCAFSPPLSRSSETHSRRELIGRALLASSSGLALAGPVMPASAVAPPSPQQILKSRSVYGSRVFRLQDATPAVIVGNSESAAWAAFSSASSTAKDAATSTPNARSVLGGVPRDAPGIPGGGGGSRSP